MSQTEKHFSVFPNPPQASMCHEEGDEYLHYLLELADRLINPSDNDRGMSD